MPSTAANIDAKIVYTMSPLVWKICGPGCTPCRRNAPRITAVAPLPGMPRARSGTMWPPTVAVEASWGATIPSGMPVPSLSRRAPYCASTP